MSSVMSTVAPPMAAALRPSQDLSWSVAGGFAEALSCCGANEGRWKADRATVRREPAPEPEGRPAKPLREGDGSDGQVHAADAPVHEVEPDRPTRARDSAGVASDTPPRPAENDPAREDPAVGSKVRSSAAKTASKPMDADPLAGPKGGVSKAEVPQSREARAEALVRRFHEDRPAPPAPRGETTAANEATDKDAGKSTGKESAKADKGETGPPPAARHAAGDRWLLSLDARRMLPGEQVRALEHRWLAWENRQSQPAKRTTALGEALASGQWIEARKAGAVTTARVAAPAPREAVDLPRLLEQFSARMRLIASGAEREAWLELEPASLGKLRVQLQEADGRWHLRLSVESPEALEAIKRCLADLEAGLAKQGLELGRVDLALDPDAERRRRERERQQGEARPRRSDGDGAPFVEQLDRHLRTAARPGGEAR